MCKTSKINYHIIVIRSRAIRFYIATSVNLERSSEGGMQNIDASFRTAAQTLCSTQDVIDFDEIYRDLSSQQDRFCNQGSGWIMNRVIEFVLHVSQYRPLVGSSFIPSPDFIVNKHAVVNVKNEDNMCFLWSVLSALHPVKINSDRLCNYTKYQNTLNFSGIRFPVHLGQIRLFERNNQPLNINVYEYRAEEDDAIIPNYLSKYPA